MTPFESKPEPGLKALDSAVIARCSNEERIYIGQMAELWEMTVSEYVRFATLRYTQTVLERATDMTLADVAIEESRQRAAIEETRKVEVKE